MVNDILVWARGVNELNLGGNRDIQSQRKRQNWMRTATKEVFRLNRDWSNKARMRSKTNKRSWMREMYEGINESEWSKKGVPGSCKVATETPYLHQSKGVNKYIYVYYNFEAASCTGIYPVVRFSQLLNIGKELLFQI